MRTQTFFGNDLLTQANQRAADRAGEKFRQEQTAAYKADLQLAAKKLGLKLTEENLSAIAREMRAMKAAPKKKSI